MGGFLTKVIDSLASLRTSKKTRLLLLGLDGAGKTTILYKMKLNEYLNTVPTVGFNVESIEYKNLNMTIWDVGGQTSIRKLWKHYFTGTDAVVYVIDSSDKERLDLAKEELYGLINDEELRDVLLLVLANKQDIAAYPIAEIMGRLDLQSLKREWKLQGCCATTGDGLTEGFDWISGHLKKKK